MAHCPVPSAFISWSLDLTPRQEEKKVWEALWVSFFIMTKEKKYLSSPSFFSGFYEVRRKVQPQGQVGFEAGDSEQFRALLEESGLLLFPHLCLPLSCPLHWKEPVGLFSAAHILMTGLLEPSRRKCKLSTWAYVQDSLSKLRRCVSSVIYLWLLLMMNRKSYLNSFIKAHITVGFRSFWPWS